MRRWWSRAEHGAVVTLCSYEVTAIFSRGRLPTITAYNRRWPLVGHAICWALVWHFAAATAPLRDRQTVDT